MCTQNQLQRQSIHVLRERIKCKAAGALHRHVGSIPFILMILFHPVTLFLFYLKRHLFQKYCFSIQITLHPVIFMKLHLLMFVSVKFPLSILLSHQRVFILGVPKKVVFWHFQQHRDYLDWRFFSDKNYRQGTISEQILKTFGQCQNCQN